jgi:hypothetical protein
VFLAATGKTLGKGQGNQTILLLVLVLAARSLLEQRLNGYERKCAKVWFDPFEKYGLTLLTMSMIIARLTSLLPVNADHASIISCASNRQTAG